MNSFEELRRLVMDLEKSARTLPYTPADPAERSHIEVRLLSFSELSTELDKLYKIKAAKKYLK